MAAAKVTGPGVSDMRILAAKLHAADADLKKNLRRELRQAAKDIVPAVQRSILDMPALRQEGLREEVAASVYATSSLTRTGVQAAVVSSGRRMPDGKRSLPRHLDEGAGWAHPVFGHGPRGTWTWVRQHGKTHWFEDPVARSAGDARDACARAIGDTLRRLG